MALGGAIASSWWTYRVDMILFMPPTCESSMVIANKGEYPNNKVHGYFRYSQYHVVSLCIMYSDPPSQLNFIVSILLFPNEPY
jgi:hypothetical protein